MNLIRTQLHVMKDLYRQETQNIRTCKVWFNVILA